MKKQKKPTDDDRVCGTCVWWDGAFCDNDDDREMDEWETCKDWVSRKSPRYKDDE